MIISCLIIISVNIRMHLCIVGNKNLKGGKYEKGFDC